jgi:methionyl aminopeptidase
MTIDSENDLHQLKAIGRICAQALKVMMQAARAGMSTGELDAIGYEFLTAEGARSAPQVTYNFPGTTCISISPVIAHGIPGKAILKAGDLIHIDVSAELDGYFADTGASLAVAAKRPEVGRLLRATRAALDKALLVVRAGARLNEIGKAIYQEAHKSGFNVIYDLTGHGIGRKLHDEPGSILNYYNPQDRRVMNEGLVLAIEPFLTTGVGRIVQENDGWTLRTSDRKIAAQFEHTVIVTKNEPVILTL